MEGYDKSFWDRALHLACVLTVVAAFVACLPSLGVPIGLSAEGDALDYHLPLIRWIVRHHSYPNWNWTFEDDFPLLGELLMIPFFLVKTEFARIVSIAAYFGTAWVTGEIAAEIAKEKSRDEIKELRFFVFACVLGFQPLLVQACHVMVDNVANVFALYALLELLRGRAFKAGIAQTLALNTRYTVWGSLPAAAAAYLFLAKREKQNRARDLAAFLAVSLAGITPLLVRNALLNGNPVYPILDGLFHGIPYNGPGPWGRGKDALSLLLFPYDLFYTNTFDHDLFDTKALPGGGPYGYHLGFLTYVQLVALALLLKLNFENLNWREFFRRPVIRANAVYAVVAFAFWFAGIQILRYYGFGLALLNLAILYPLATRASKGARAALVLLTVPAIAYAQAETWKIAFGSEKSFREQPYVQAAFDCFQRARVPKDALVGWTTRDGLLGYFDYDFVFVPPHDLYRQLPGTSPPKPDFLFSGMAMDPHPGYEAWPKEKPCMQKLVR